MVVSFRLAGLSSDKPSDLDRFLAFVKAVVPDDRHHALKAVKWPAADPHAIIVYLGDLTPAITVHEGADGSLLFIDGELFNADYRQGASAGPGSGAALLETMGSDPLKALDAIDAAAFVTYLDAKDGRVHIARDAIGNVPVFYTFDGTLLAWSADLTTLMAMDPGWTFNDEAVDFFLASGYVPAPWTFVQDIWKLEPGYAVGRNRGGRAAARRYIDYRVPAREVLPESEVIKRISDLFPRAVERRLRHRGQTGLLLSGGVDSKVVLGAMAKELGVVPDTFTFRYKGYRGDLNEGHLARECARHFGAEHHEIDVDPALFPEQVKSLLDMFGEPFSYGLHTVMLNQITTRGISDLLTGTGADGAWFLGAQQIGAIKFQNLPGPARTLLEVGVTAAQAGAHAIKSAGFFRDKAPVRFYRSIWTARTKLPALLTDMITPHYFRRHLHADKNLGDRGRAAALDIFQRALNDTRGLDDHHRFRVLQTRYYGADMMQSWNHWSGRGQGLSIRAPYYDREMLSFLHSQPFMRPDKVELREYAATLMPREMAYAPKLAQSVPIRTWMQGPFREWVHDTLAPERLKISGRFDSGAVQKLLSDYYAGASLPRGAGWTIWNLMMVTIWHELKRAEVSAAQFR